MKKQMPADPVTAGRKGGKIGGRSKSAKKLAAARRNGFQPRPYDLKRVEEAIRTCNYEGLRADEMVDALAGKPGFFHSRSAEESPKKEPADESPKE